ncbi:MAG: hypothetical protein NVSMB9_22150 [Isosphaeraceae bacterium]
MIRPDEARPWLDVRAPVCTQRTFLRFVTLFGSTILTTVRRTVSHILSTAAPSAQGQVTTYQWVLSSAEWSALKLARQFCRLILALIPAEQTVVLVGDETVNSYPGGKVWPGIGTVCSSHGYPGWRYGHTRDVLAILIGSL